MSPRSLPAPLHVANEALAFFLELAVLAALGCWGATAGGGPVLDVVLGIGAPLLAAVAWALFAAPRARIRLPMAGIVAVKALVFGGAVMVIAAMGRHGLAACFAVVTFANTGIAVMDRAAAVHTASR